MIFYTQIKTPLGRVLTAANEMGIILVDFAENPSAHLHLKKFANLLNLPISETQNAYLQELQKELEAYFLGERMQFTVPIELIGTTFQKSVWLSLSTIPFGKTISYAEQAKMLGRPTAIRAVAHANSLNPLSIILPCHRVIGSDGSLKGYAGGIVRKKWLLDFEK